MRLLCLMLPILFAAPSSAADPASAPRAARVQPNSVARLPQPPADDLKAVANKKRLEQLHPDAGLDGLTEDELFGALDSAFTLQRKDVVLRKISAQGNLATAARLERFELPGLPRSWVEFETAGIRFRITGNREYHVQQTLLTLEGCSKYTAEEAVAEGMVEARPQIIACTHDSSRTEPGDAEVLKRYLVVLDLWDRALVKTKEEIYAAAVELDDLQQKLWGLRKLTALPSVSPPIIARVNAAMKPRIAAGRKFRSTFVHFPVTDPADERRLDEAFNLLCNGVRPFWEAHSKADLEADWADGVTANDPTNCGE